MDAIAQARKIVENIVRDVEVGDVYEGKVVKIMENDKGQFGASVNFAPGKDGMIHISKLSKERVDKVTELVNVGDIVLVKVIKIDEKHRVDLRLKEIIKKAEGTIRRITASKPFPQCGHVRPSTLPLRKGLFLVLHPNIALRRGHWGPRRKYFRWGRSANNCVKAHSAQGPRENP